MYRSLSYEAFCRKQQYEVENPRQDPACVSDPHSSRVAARDTNAIADGQIPRTCAVERHPHLEPRVDVSLGASFTCCLENRTPLPARSQKMVAPIGDSCRFRISVRMSSRLCALLHHVFCSGLREKTAIGNLRIHA